MKAPALVFLAFHAAATPAFAASFNLKCDAPNGVSVTLIVREAWLQYTQPSIRVTTEKAGDTAAVDITQYNEDAIKVEVSIKLSLYPDQLSALELAIDRNTGVVDFAFKGPWQTADGGAKWRKTVDSFTGHCAREAPRF